MGPESLKFITTLTEPPEISFAEQKKHKLGYLIKPSMPSDGSPDQGNNLVCNTL